jgi:hypothetical protein
MVLLIFVVVPIVAVVLGYDQSIYENGEISINLLLSNTFSAMPFFLAAGFCRVSVPYPHRLDRSEQANYPVVLSLFVIGWTVAFLLFGGLTYREEDVSLGFAARSPVLNLLQPFESAIQLSCTYLFLVMPRLATPLRSLAIISIVSYSSGIILSGSRGLVMQLLLSFWASRQLVAVQFPPRANSALSAAVGRLIKVVFYLLAALVGIAIIGVWGVYRDKTDDVVFETLFRLAEPYWYYATVYHEGRDIDWNVLGDALTRIASIPQRWFGVSFDGTIDGHEVIVEKYLGITNQEGVSLPITLVGEGQLFAGHIGAFLFNSAAAGMICLSVRIVHSLPFANKILLICFLANVFSRCFLLYPKSLSGTFLVLFYEVLRDYVVICVLFGGLGRVFDVVQNARRSTWNIA